MITIGQGSVEAVFGSDPPRFPARREEWGWAPWGSRWPS